MSEEKKSSSLDALSEKELRSILNDLVDAFYRTDAEGRFVIVSSSASRYLGYTVDELIGTPVKDLYVRPEERDEFLQKLMASGGNIVDFRSQLRHKDGSIVWSSSSARLLYDEEGNISGLEGIARDVTAHQKTQEELQQSEETLRQLTEHLSEVFWVEDIVQDKILYISPAYERLTGRSCESFYKDSASFFTSIHPEDQKRVENSLQDIQTHGFKEIYRLVRPDDSFVWVSVRAFPVRDENGNVHRIVGIAEDISYIKTAMDVLEKRISQKEWELLKTRTRAEKAHESKERLLMSLNQEIRTPLNAVIGFTQLLKLENDANLTSEQCNYINGLAKAADQLLLAVSKITVLSEQKEED